MPAMKCQNCGSNEIESDSTRADSVCTKCGTVCESGIIVSDVQFEENAHGGSSALGKLVYSQAEVRTDIHVLTYRNFRVV